MHQHDHTYDPAIAERKQKNREVFEETMRICREGGYVAPSGVRVNLPPVKDVLEASVFYVNPPRVDEVPPADASVCDMVHDDCVKVARRLVEEGYRPIMLNMANRHTPGGRATSACRSTSTANTMQGSSACRWATGSIRWTAIQAASIRDVSRSSARAVAMATRLSRSRSSAQPSP